MIELHHVKFEPDNLLVGRALRVKSASSDSAKGCWQGLYLHEGKVFTLPFQGERFNACRDEVRKHYLNKKALTLSNQLHSPSIGNWDIYGANDGWRLEFKYDLIKDVLTYTQPGKSFHAAEADAVQVAPDPEPEDFPVTIGAKHQIKTAEALQAFTEALGETDLGNTLVTAITNAEITTISDPLAEQAKKYPAYWRELPKNWQYIDYYRVAELFPRGNVRLDHALKKLLVPGVRTGGKAFRKDIAEAYATIGQWLKENPDE